jgi:ribosomal protein S18 acetylase RimI-like enzyme
MLVHRPIRDAAEKAEADLLLARCDVAEGIETPVVIPPPGELPDGGSAPFLLYKGESLAGLLVLEGWPIPEAAPLVHPDFRRRGIGRALVGAATEDCRSRGGKRWLLTAEAQSMSAPRFAEAVGGRYDSAEYRMELDTESVPAALQPESAHLKEIGEEDVDLFATTLARAFDDPLDQVREWTTEQLGHPNVRLFVAFLGERPVGTLRIIVIGFHAYITAVGVLAEARRRGIGRWIVQSAIHELLQEGFEKIRIEVDVTNEAALRLYRQCGFRETRKYLFFEVLT